MTFCASPTHNLLFFSIFLYLSFVCLAFDSSAETTTTTLTTTTIEGRLENVDKTPFNVTTRITLNNAEYTTYSRTDGSFIIYDVPPGIHQLDVHSTEYHFGQIKIQLLEESMDTPKCLEYPYPGAVKQVTKYPLVLYPYAKYEYFVKQRGFSPFALLKNPMVLMMIFGGIMTFVMPKMMEGLDPEEKAAMRKQMEAQKDPTKMLSNMWGEITGSTQDDDAAGKSRKERRQQRSKRN